MNGQPIPGYYFDEEKKKYFKIQSRTASQGGDFKYSVDNIKKLERKERIQNITIARSNKVRKERVVRRNPNSFVLTHVEREIGIKRSLAYIQHLWPDACAFGIESQPQQVITTTPSQPFIRLFDRDPVSRTIYAVHGSNSIKQQKIQSNKIRELEESNEEHDLALDNPYAFYPWDEIARTTSIVSSLRYLPATGALAVTTLGSDRPPELWLSDPDRDEPYVGQKITPKNCATIWDVAARPTTFSPLPGLVNSVAASHVEHLATAASHSMLLSTRSQTGAWDTTVPVKDLPSEVIALEWISYTTVVLGCRNGSIRLYDTRSGGSSQVLTHPGPISKLKRADDETRLICSGLDDTLFLYDIRSPRLSRNASRKTFNYENHHYNEQYFRSLYPNNRDTAKRRKLNHKAFKNWSQPMLTFVHANRDELDLDIDVHPRLGLLAAAQDLSTDAAIRISNIWTGRTVKEIHNQSKRSGKTCGRETIRTLKFVDRDDELGGVDLWSCWNAGIAKFTW
ncbi:hypothetical protein PtrSN002B_004302 [Pyrenophora tritici-repentis]|uniref:Uncharacterized protein n=1 Tax=Pyrenophora tritici-repentis TaxID=45151 RepID=A0A2W1E7Z1_9PLEO|nr:hypothetical protein PtrV1_07225 [Pyrenophora tritici-repentis]KAF7448281.1 hypothetical protein A1F99_076450 [Pyrenophora tritici-repentis]KAF7571999.1 hypothetical protein PtrM4_094990 [Pyrenophora tritici-repentis]KAG9384817.1 hypothetical protein A1F94_004364 [Pyrenophora tritici-repentis]KAI0579988.1 hypothetical protein Alg215_05474 [Pyrenophora tritici-repentis]